jgi:hypothetical protein
MFHNYRNETNYGFTAVSSVFRPHAPPEPEVYDEPSENAIAAPPSPVRRRRTLPGVKLLKKLHKAREQQQSRPLDLKKIERSIEGILSDLTI